VEKKLDYIVEHINEMINVVNKTCKNNSCNTQPNYNYKGLKQKLYCKTHKLDGMVDVSHPTCKNDFCETRANEKNKKYKGYCAYCYINMFPNKPVSRNYKTKEKAVSDYIKEVFNNMDWICDRKVQDGCSQKRPDLLLELGYQVIIIEVDEQQHNGYSCENKRLMEISQDLGHRPIVLIRFNPDSYKDGDKKITSCWSNNSKSGLNTIKQCKKQEWSNRLLELKNNVDFWLNNKTNKTIELVELFFNK
jgi:hypothetical protein